VELKDLDITITGSTLTLKGERKMETGIADEKYYRRERGAGPFGRSLELPHKVDHDRVEASLRDGILKIRLPKAPEIQPRRIEVKS
jgi:HSP20 family protein